MMHASIRVIARCDFHFLYGMMQLQVGTYMCVFKVLQLLENQSYIFI